MKTMRKIVLVIGVSSVLLGMAPDVAQALEIWNWVVGTETWYDRDHWRYSSNKGVPGQGDWAEIKNGGTAQLIVDGEAFASWVKVAVANNTSGTVELSAGSLTVNKLTVGYYEGNGTGLFKLDGDGTLNVASTMQVSATGTFDQDGGSNVGTSASIFLFGTYDQSGGTNAFSNLEMHTATYNLSGGTCSFGNVRLGKVSGTNSKFDMSGGSLIA